MAQITFLNALDQPTGRHRFLDELVGCLQSDSFTTFRFAVAFAKMGPFLRLEEHIIAWKAKGKTINGIFGIDLMGTSIQVLEYALDTFDNVYITHANAGAVTFHPKQYLFSGEQYATAYVGSHNLTVGGTETNFEAGIKIEMELPSDTGVFQQALLSWESLLPDEGTGTLQLDRDLLNELQDRGLLLDEDKSTRVNITRSKEAPKREAKPTLFPKQSFRPPRPIPKNLLKPKRKISAKPRTTQKPISREVAASSAETFIIQIVPHHNGEVFLSYTAVKQNQDFFEYPFNGWTTPKKATNKPYPQRDPDPKVNIFIYDANGNLAVSKYNYDLNTVDYTAKSEIRITFSPDLIAEIPERSILVMEKSPEPDLDYIIRVYAPGSEDFDAYLTACNQELPSGGKPNPRRMGWI